MGLGRVTWQPQRKNSSVVSLPNIRPAYCKADSRRPSDKGSHWKSDVTAGSVLGGCGSSLRLITNSYNNYYNLSSSCVSCYMRRKRKIQLAQTRVFTRIVCIFDENYVFRSHRWSRIATVLVRFCSSPSLSFQFPHDTLIPDGKRITWDSRKGFIIANATYREIGLLACETTVNGHLYKTNYLTYRQSKWCSRGMDVSQNAPACICLMKLWLKKFF